MDSAAGRPRKGDGGGLSNHGAVDHLSRAGPKSKRISCSSQGRCQKIGVFVSASEGFSQENNNCSVAEALARAKQVADQAMKLGIAVRG